MNKEDIEHFLNVIGKSPFAVYMKNEDLIFCLEDPEDCLTIWQKSVLIIEHWENEEKHENGSITKTKAKYHRLVRLEDISYLDTEF